MFVFAASILASTALVVNPTKIAYAQANATATLDTEGIIKNLKAKSAVLSALTGDEDSDLLSKIKGLDPTGAFHVCHLHEYIYLLSKIKFIDAKEAVKAALALNIIRELRQYKAVDEAQ